MKKILVITIGLILIPYLIVNLFIKEEEIKFEYGTTKIVRVKRDKLNRIDNVPFESYVVGVLSGEMPVSFELEALKAQAVAARSYLLRKMETSSKDAYDIIDTVANQVYLDDSQLRKNWGSGYTEKINKIKKAVQETKGLYLEYEGKVAQAFFFSTSTGMTENSEDVFVSKLPYLRSVSSEWDKEVSPVFTDQEEYTLSDFYDRLNLPYQDKVEVKILKQTATGRNQSLSINGKTFKANDVYSALKLRSTYFSIKQEGNKVIINTKGFGHGVGLSQYGAQGMAKAGYGYDEILKHYYQGIEIKKI